MAAAASSGKSRTGTGSARSGRSASMRCSSSSKTASMARCREAVRAGPDSRGAKRAATRRIAAAMARRTRAPKRRSMDACLPRSAVLSKEKEDLRGHARPLSRRWRLLAGNGAEDRLQADHLTVAHHVQADAAPGLRAGHLPAQRARAAYRSAIEADDHVPGAQTGLLCGAVGRDRRHQHARLSQAELVGE